MTELTKNFPSNLALLRKMKGLTTEELAIHTDVARTSIVSYKLGKTVPTILTASMIAKTLGCTLDQLVVKKMVISITEE